MTPLIKAVVFILLSSLCAPLYAGLQSKPHTGYLGIEYQSDVEGQYGFDDNVTYQKKNKVSSDFFNVKPNVVMRGETNKSSFYLFYRGDYRQYQYEDTYYNNDSDNYLDHYYGFNNDWRIASKNLVSLNISEMIGHESRGQGLTEGFTSPQLSAYGVNHVIGTRLLNSKLSYKRIRPKSIHKLNISLAYLSLKYEDRNNEIQHDLKAYMKKEEWQEVVALGELFTQMSDDTRIRTSVINHFRRSLDPIDENNRHDFLLGIKSQITGKTLLEANVLGFVQRFINVPSAKAFKGMKWNANLAWSPTVRAKFSIFTHRTLDDVADSGSYVKKDDFGIDWRQEWGVRRLSSTAGYSYAVENYKISEDGRKDKTHQASFKLKYDFRPSIQFVFGYDYHWLHSNRESTKLYLPHHPIPVKTKIGFDKSVYNFLVKVKI